MKVLVAYASRMGSNAEIAERVAAQLSRAGHAVTVCPFADAPDAGSFDAVVLGSALYLGRWDRTAVRYLRAHASALADRPTWLFQSGPCGVGAELEHVDTPRAVGRLARRIGLAAPVTFGGRLDRARATTRISRWMATGRYAGDFRDWDVVRAWTTGLIEELTPGRAGAAVPGP